MLYFRFLNDIPRNFVIDGFGNFRFFRERAQQFKLAVSFVLFLLDIVDEISNIVDVISEEDTGEEGNNDDEEGLNGIIGMQITETNSEDDGGSEVIAPNVLLVPLQLIYAIGNHPIVFPVHSGNHNQGASEEVAYKQILDDHLEKTPVFHQLRCVQILVLQLVELLYEV